jgi:hypothetical protein
MRPPFPHTPGHFSTGLTTRAAGSAAPGRGAIPTMTFWPERDGGRARGARMRVEPEKLALHAVDLVV